MQKLIKVTSDKLSGAEKAAILLAEIGTRFNGNYDELAEALHLSKDEMKKIRKAMERLGPYNPALRTTEEGIAEIKREQAVLNEVIEFGKRRGIFHPVETHNVPNQYVKRDSSNVLSDMIHQDPEAMAKILSGWLGEE